MSQRLCVKLFESEMFTSEISLPWNGMSIIEKIEISVMRMLIYCYAMQSNKSKSFVQEGPAD